MSTSSSPADEANKEDRSDEKTTDNSSADDQSEEPEKENDIYNHFNDATWEDDFHGFKSRVLKVVTTNNLELDDGKHSMVGIKLEVENTTKKAFDTFPANGTLVLSTGEQVVGATSYSPDEINGTIYEGVSVTSNINFLVQSNVDEIKWIKFIWFVGQRGNDNTYNVDEEYQVKLTLE
ncbi:hypothetical protein KO561_12955 [Radiobacillus kanasensis]|uniref:hypothetical protein n=1 Tax=Radiobacillus kanasensis TaxID=2844358 RepID=UPI001E475E9E|nr:hypothetical protein [Radiobacillus kanasensis]UFT98111.1 hypothetical protein KO561_12955 [Radiobacillus kanasensis]